MKLNNNKSTKMRNFSFFIFTFSLIMISTSLWGEFSRYNSGVIADNKTGLAWQDDYRDNGGEIKRATTLEDALIYCHELTLGGQSDWRLPNIRELKSIVDDSKYNPSISSIFQNVTSNDYRSSTTVVLDSYNVWDVDFYYGYNFSGVKTDMARVRCVRGGQ